jgi:hypothetical protein
VRLLPGAPRPHQPGFVVNALLGVCAVYRDHRVNGVTSGAKGVRDEVAAETSIDKERRRLRRPPGGRRGSPPRRPAASNRSRVPRF